MDLMSQRNLLWCLACIIFQYQTCTSICVLLYICYYLHIVLLPHNSFAPLVAQKVETLPPSFYPAMFASYNVYHS